MPAASFAAVVMVAVNCVLPANAPVGVNDTVLPVTVTVPATAAPPTVGATVTLVVVSVAFVIGSEKVAVTGAERDTPVAPLVGVVDATVGGVRSGAAPVVKLHDVLAASALPAASFAAVVTVAVYCVLPARPTLGVNVAVLPATDTVPATAAPPAVGTSVKLEVVNVAFVIGSENVTDAEVLSATPVAPLPGVLAMIVGAVTSGAAAVVKVHATLPASGLPDASVTAVERVAVYCVVPASGSAGVKVASAPATLMVPATALPPFDGVSVKLAVVIVASLIVSENVALTVVLRATPVAPLAGVVAVTVGAVRSGVTPVVNVSTKLLASALPDASFAAVVMVTV